MNRARRPPLPRVMILLTLLLAGLARPMAAGAEPTTVTETKTIPLSVPAFVDCLGETVLATGDLQVLHRVTFFDNGVVHVLAFGVVPNASAVGQTSGRTYTGFGWGYASFLTTRSALPLTFYLPAWALLSGSDGHRLLVFVVMQEMVNADGTIHGAPVAVRVWCL